MKTYKTTSLADQVFEKLENDIIQGIYPRGELLTELKLVEQLGVSRTPIREALRRLEQERLIEDTGKGSRVLGITVEDLEDIMNIRERIEGLAAYYAARNITPDGVKSFCSCMRENPDFDRRCIHSDRCAMEIARERKSLYVYQCHAGFTEAVAPITEGERIIGYIMFGQIVAKEHESDFLQHIGELAETFGNSVAAVEMLKQIRCMDKDKIISAAKILDACAGYIQLKEYVQPAGKTMMDRLSLYVHTHLTEDLSVDSLCAKFGISRTKLYDITREHTNGGLAAWIRQIRLEQAKKLIQSTDLSVTDIAEQCGFTDYNYFLRIFKRTYGVSSRAMRKYAEPCDQ